MTADFNRRLGGAALQQLKLRCVGIEIWRFVNIGLAHFPRRVVQFAGIVEHSQLNGSFQNLAPQLFIIQKGDIAVFVQQQTVLAVLQHVLAATQVGLYRAGGVCRRHIQYQVAHRRHGGQHRHVKCLAFFADYLAGQLITVSIQHSQVLAVVIQSYMGFYRFCSGKGQGIVYDQGAVRYPLGIQLVGNGTHCTGVFSLQLHQRGVVVVPPGVVNVHIGGARQIVVKLVLDQPFPGLGHRFLRVGIDPQQLRGGEGALCHIGQHLTLAVQSLAHRPGSVTAGTVAGHQQLVVPHGQTVLVTVRQGINVLENLVGLRTDHIKVFSPIFCRAGAHALHALLCGSAANVAGAVQVLGIGKTAFKGVLCHIVNDGHFAAQVAAEFGAVRPGVGARQHTAAVHALPITQGKGHAVGTAPTELLGSKAQQPGILHHRRQRLAEAKAVRQKNVLRLHAELFLKIPIAKENIAKKCLRRGNIHIAVLIAGTGGIPVAALY